MSETEKAQGKDYGAYTVVDPSEVKEGHETDFSIVGFGWGKDFNPTWKKNKVFFKDFKRKLLYSTFQYDPGWTYQFEFILDVINKNKAQAYFFDIERSEWGLRPDLDLKQQCLDAERILKNLRDLSTAKIGIYSNFYDYYLLSLHVDLSSFPWWAADPDHYPGDHPGSLNLWNKWASNRTLHDYHFDQWDWKAYAPDYGAINSKKSMDLTQFNGTVQELDIWLGIIDAPEPPPQPDPEVGAGIFIPSIPYKSQKDPDAKVYANDCGPSALAIILNAHGKNTTTDEVYRRTGAPANEYVRISQMRKAALSYDIPFDYFSSSNLDELKELVAAGKVPIPLVHYGAWSELSVFSTQSKFKGPHFVVVVGFDDEHIYVNDPLWWGTRRSEGEHKQWTYAEFNAAWGSANKDGNRDFSGIVCTVPLATEVLGEDEVPPDQPPIDEKKIHNLAIENFYSKITEDKNDLLRE